MNGYTRKEEMPRINSLSLYLRKLKKEQFKPKARREKGT